MVYAGIYHAESFRSAQYHDPNFSHGKKKGSFNNPHFVADVISFKNICHPLSSNSGSHTRPDYLKLNCKDGKHLFTLAVILASIVPVAGVEAMSGEALAARSHAATARPALVLSEDEALNAGSRAKSGVELDANIRQMKSCKSIIDRIIKDDEKAMFSQSYMSGRCQKIYDDIRVVSEALNLPLQTYGDQSCLLYCDSTRAKITTNTVLLNNEITRLNAMRLELDQSPITPDDNKLREEIREKKDIAKAAIWQSAMLKRTCEKNKAQAEWVRTNARFNKNNFIFNCDGVFPPHVDIPDFDDNPPDSAFYKVRNHVRKMEQERGEAEVEIVQAENQRHRLGMLAVPRVG